MANFDYANMLAWRKAHVRQDEKHGQLSEGTLVVAWENVWKLPTELTAGTPLHAEQ